MKYTAKLYDFEKQYILQCNCTPFGDSHFLSRQDKAPKNVNVYIACNYLAKMLDMIKKLISGISTFNLFQSTVEKCSGSRWMSNFRNLLEISNLVVWCFFRRSYDEKAVLE